MLPTRLGGLGYRFAVRHASAAYLSAMTRTIRALKGLELHALSAAIEPHVAADDLGWKCTDFSQLGQAGTFANADFSALELPAAPNYTPPATELAHCAMWFRFHQAAADANAAAVQTSYATYTKKTRKP